MGVARALWIVLGIGCVVLGTIGVVLPLVPTTPFILLAVFAFARSSPRLHRWLIEHRRFGPLIDNWHAHGAIDRRTKIGAIVVIVAAPLLTVAIGAPVWVLGLQVVVLCGVATFILTRPEGPAIVVDSKVGRRD